MFTRFFGNLLGNFGAFDPQLAAKDISGLTHGSKLDRSVWDEFHADWNGLAILADDLRQKLRTSSEVDQATFPTGPSERLIERKQRLHQAFFRDAVLSSYNARCCITGLSISQCLVAGHIIPWSRDESRRADPANGLCLSATFDRLFDAGLMTITDDFLVCISDSIINSNDPVIAELIASKHDQPLMLPSRFRPDRETLRWHRQNVFVETRK